MEITPEHLEQALAAQQVTPRPGDALLVRSGWGQLWAEGAPYVGKETGVPGVGEAGAHWLAGHLPVVVGADTIAFERVEPGKGHASLPAHRVLLVEAGIPIIEAIELEELAATASYEFTFIAIPLPLVGATGSPIRPVALILDED
jgi:kynurenine formamidase